MKLAALPLAALALTLAACANEDTDTDITDLESANSDGEAAAMAQALPAGDFMDLELGAKIIGPQGDEVVSRMTNAEGAFADIRSYVACPASMDPCDPANAPEGTVYTYVHVVHPGEDNDPDTGSGEGNDSSDVEIADNFRMTMPSHGFTGTAVYSKAEALAAVGPEVDVVMVCHEGGLSWTIEASDGGDQWEQAEPLTFYWQSTLLPSGPAQAYEIFANRAAAQGNGPYPAAHETVPNACAAG